MKTLIINIGITNILAIVLMFSCTRTEGVIEKECDCISIPVPDDIYIYPFRPGDNAWSKLNGYERIEACQLPDSLLKVISTQGLVETCVNHPLIEELIFSDLPFGLQDAMERMMQMFNCLEELSIRTDAGSKLLSRYLLMKPCCVKDRYMVLDQGDFVNSYSEYEMIFAQEIFIEQMSRQELITLTAKALSTYHEKVEYVDYYSWIYGMNTSAFLIARCMFRLQYEPFLQEMEKSNDLKQFVNNCSLPGSEPDLNNFFEKINDFAKDLLKQEL
ncbi:hypothetical protein [Draconibacterium orientale]|uniref:hypothetical protein n=1 Tax=Draconibacterium orientale TaxID=1168034 RepID=UPI0029C0C6F9|nr:hypothetical protein [Draconibacterium orientale]